MTTFSLPDLGEGLQEAELLAWHVGPGDHVVADQPIVSVETDKAVVEIPAPFSGSVVALHAADGDIVRVGAPLLDIDTGERADSGAIVGSIETTPDRPVEAAPRAIPTGSEPGVRAVPAARKLAGELNVDISTIAGTGPGGVVTLADVEKARESSAGGEELRGPRRVMAATMAAAGKVVVPATITDRAIVHDWRDDENVMRRLVRSLVAGCHAEPDLNAHFNGKFRTVLERIDIAIAVDTTAGLFTPVLRNADKIGDVEKEITRLRNLVETRAILAGDMRDATITLSNFGPLGGEHASLVVTPPQVAILGVGRIRSTSLADRDGVRVGRMLPLSLTFDHRVVTGGEAARFLNAVRIDLEKPV